MVALEGLQEKEQWRQGSSAMGAMVVMLWHARTGARERGRKSGGGEGSFWRSVMEEQGARRRVALR